MANGSAKPSPSIAPVKPGNELLPEPSGTRVTGDQALGLLRSGKLMPVGDGLLGLESARDLAPR